MMMMMMMVMVIAADSDAEPKPSVRVLDDEGIRDVVGQTEVQGRISETAEDANAETESASAPASTAEGAPVRPRQFPLDSLGDGDIRGSCGSGREDRLTATCAVPSTHGVPRRDFSIARLLDPHRSSSASARVVPATAPMDLRSCGRVQPPAIPPENVDLAVRRPVDERVRHEEGRSNVATGLGARQSSSTIDIGLGLCRSSSSDRRLRSPLVWGCVADTVCCSSSTTCRSCTAELQLQRQMTDRRQDWQLRHPPSRHHRGSHRPTVRYDSIRSITNMPSVL